MITHHCITCDKTIKAPNKGLGRAKVAAWDTHHQGHDVRQEVTPR